MVMLSVYAPASYAVTDTSKVPSSAFRKTHDADALAATAFPFASNTENAAARLASHVAFERPDVTRFPCASRAEMVAVRLTPTRPPNNAPPTSVAPEAAASAAPADTATVAGDPWTCSPRSLTATTCVPAVFGVSATSTTPLALVCVIVNETSEPVTSTPSTVTATSKKSAPSPASA